MEIINLITIEEIKFLEERLLKAMQKSDVTELDALISDDLVFTDHNGTVLKKTDDLNAHRSGMFSMDSIEPTEQIIKIYDNTAIVSVLLKIKGKFANAPFEGSNRFTRIWLNKNGNWQIIAAHSTSVK